MQSRTGMRSGLQTVPAFDDSDRAYLAVNLPPEVNEDPLTLALDNALLLLYAVAVISSPDDEQRSGAPRSTW